MVFQFHMQHNIFFFLFTVFHWILLWPWECFHSKLEKNHMTLEKKMSSTSLDGFISIFFFLIFLLHCIILIHTNAKSHCCDLINTYVKWLQFAFDINTMETVPYPLSSIVLSLIFFTALNLLNKEKLIRNFISNIFSAKFPSQKYCWWWCKMLNWKYKCFMLYEYIYLKRAEIFHRTCYSYIPSSRYRYIFNNVREFWLLCHRCITMNTDKREWKTKHRIILIITTEIVYWKL